MAKLDAAELLARVRRRKQELLEEQTSESSHDHQESPEQSRPRANPYIGESASPHVSASARPRLALRNTTASVRLVDDSELLYLPTAPPSSVREWWDGSGNLSEISSLVCRPGRLDLPRRNLDEGAPVKLTAEERKRKRKQERAIKRQDAQERVRLGIDPPSSPKLKVSNVAAIVGPAFVHDPTRYEELARTSEIQRREAHEMANMERQLTPDQRWLKLQAKITSHRERELHVAVFRLEHLDDSAKQQQFLVDCTAKKLLFTGTALMGAPALVIVEGGEPEVVKYKKLLTRKIAQCTLLWTGLVSQAHFKAWTLHNFPSEALKKAFLRNHRALSYYELLQDVPLS